jgi:hypothetical protein
MSFQDSVEKILADVALDEDFDSRDSSRVEELMKLIDDFGWEVLESEMLGLLAASHNYDHWKVAAGVFWNAVLDQRPLHADRLIAHLCWRFTAEDNLAWSITCKLKGVAYASDYDPRQDPAVRAALDALRGPHPEFG